jgi:SAM-dependent methyltransferase
VVVSGETTSLGDARPATSTTRSSVVWHDLECGDYRADLELWLDLAAQLDGPVLDVGAGTGRVSLALARAGHTVTALERDEQLLAALRRRAEGLAVEAVCADARSFSLARRDYALCVMPMQTIQLLGGRDGRVAFLRCARAHVRAGAIVACAILGEVEPFDCAGGRIGPTAERVRVDGVEYISRAVRVAESRRVVTIERERRIVERDGAPGRPSEPMRERDAIELDRVSARTLERDARAAGLRVEPPVEVAATDEHVGSTVVMLRA